MISRGGYWAEPLPAMARSMIAYAPSQSVVTEVDATDPSALKVVRTLTLDGAYLSARMVGSTVRIVSTAQIPETLPFLQPQTATADAMAAAKAHNRSVLSSSRLADWLPTYRLKRAGHAASKPHAMVQCRDVRRPVGFSGLGLLTVLTVDLAKGLEPVDSTAVMTDGRIVYASQSALYVATERWADRPAEATPTQEPSSGVTTAIHEFDISNPAKAVYLGSGSVPGYLLSQWSLSEFGGVLRVVSTDTPAWWSENGGDSRVVPHDAAPVERRARRRSGASAVSARASASTPCASSATPATSSRSGRSTRSTRSTSPTRSSRACSAS